MISLLFSKYWKQLLIGGVTIFVLIGAYYKGYSDCSSSHTIRDQKDTIDRVNKWNEEEKKIDKINKKIDDDTYNRPINDGRDSCILSNDPYEVNCVD